jgi:enoyl-CoA hydratase
MSYKNIKLEVNEGVGVVTLNRPEKRNALDFETWDEIRDVFREIKKNDNIHVVILTGAGGKAFASGADIGSLRDRSMISQMNSETNDILFEITVLPKPVIAAIDGFALGGGCELSMACDIRIATEKSKLGQPEVGLGIIPGGGGTQRLQRLVGIGKAKELIFTGAIIDAKEAERIGLVERVVADGTVVEEAMQMARQILKKGPVAVSLAKAAINVGSNVDLYSGLHFERYSQTIAFATDDKHEGTSAFLEKRAAEFKGK